MIDRPQAGERGGLMAPPRAPRRPRPLRPSTAARQASGSTRVGRVPRQLGRALAEHRGGQTTVAGQAGARVLAGVRYGRAVEQAPAAAGRETAGRAAGAGRQPGARQEPGGRQPGARQEPGGRQPGARQEPGGRQPGARQEPGGRQPGARQEPAGRQPGARQRPARDRSRPRDSRARSRAGRQPGGETAGPGDSRAGRQPGRETAGRATAAVPGGLGAARAPDRAPRRGVNFACPRPRHCALAVAENRGIYPRDRRFTLVACCGLPHPC